MHLEQSLLTFGWQSMNVQELVKLCQANKAFNELCNNKQTWQFLIKRDFEPEVDDPRKEYFNKVLKKFAQKHNDKAIWLDKIKSIATKQNQKFDEEAYRLNDIFA